MNGIMPIIITGVSERNIDDRRIIKLRSSLLESWCLFPVFIDNYETSDEDTQLLPLSRITVVRPDRKLTEEELQKAKIQLAFEMFKHSEFALFIKFPVEVNYLWRSQLIRILMTGRSESVGLASVYNDDPVDENYDAEPMIMDVDPKKISKDYFGISRRAYAWMNKEYDFDIGHLDPRKFIARRTSMSLLSDPDKPTPRMLF